MSRLRIWFHSIGKQATNYLQDLKKKKTPSTPSDELNQRLGLSHLDSEAKMKAARQDARRQMVKDFPWERIGCFRDPSSEDSSTFSARDLQKENRFIEHFVIDRYYSDWYWNTSLMIGTCLWAYFVARIGLGLWSLILVVFYAIQVYRLEVSRFNRNIHDDMNRVQSVQLLENGTETMQWLNSFLAKFWIIYMPVLSEQVKKAANDVLKDAAPGFGIDALSLDQFTLGSKSPTINSVKSYPKLGKDVYQMDWDFSFAPNDTDDMTKNEIKKKIDPKVALGVRVGKAFVSKNLPILVENMQFVGKMRVTIKIGDHFPNIKLVSVSFLEPPEIAYSLKPVGGDTFGLDIMSLIPGLSSFVNTLIHSNLRPMLYAPNSLDIDVEQLLEEQVQDTIGVLAVTINRADDLKSTKDCDPFVSLFTEKQEYEKFTTDIKTNTTSPYWKETKYILVTSLMQKLYFEVYHHDSNKGPKLIGSTSYSLDNVVQQEVILGQTSKLKMGGKTRGSLSYDIRWFPVLEGEELADGSKEEPPDTESGVLKLLLQGATDLSLVSSVTGKLSAYSELYLNGELVTKTRIIQNTIEPNWEESLEKFIFAKSKSRVELIVRTKSGLVEDPVVGSFKGNLDELIATSLDDSATIKLKPQGEYKLTAQWKGLALSGADASTNFVPPFGVARLHIRNADDVLNTKTVGKVDPYVRVMVNGRLKYRTTVRETTTTPVWEECMYFPVTSMNQVFSLDVMDAEKRSKDKLLGSAKVQLSSFVKKSDDGKFMAYDGAKKVLSQPLEIKKSKKKKGTIYYSMSFIPMLPVYTNTELEELERTKEERKEKELQEQKKLEQMEELFKKNPKKYEWVEVDDDLDEIPKQKLSLEQLLEYNSGSMGVQIKKGKFTKPDVYVQLLFDELAFPSYISARSQGRSITSPDVAQVFVRDLENSQTIIRISKRAIAKEQDDIIGEQSFATRDLLQRGYGKDIDLTFAGQKLQVELDFLPLSVELPQSELMADSGFLTLEILDAANLLSADSNGKSDPMAKVLLDGQEIYCTDKIKRTLDPTWDESTRFYVPSRSRSKVTIAVYDWDFAGDNDFLGEKNLPLENLAVDETQEFKVELDTQGSVRLRGTFHPEYVRPPIEIMGQSGIEKVATAPVKVIGGAANIIGGTVGVVGGGVFKGVKNVLVPSKKKQEKHDETADLTSLRSVKSGASSTFSRNSHHPKDTFIPLGAPPLPRASRAQNTDSSATSNLGSDVQSLRNGGRTPVQNGSPVKVIQSRPRSIVSSEQASVSGASKQNVSKGSVEIVSLSGMDAKNSLLVRVLVTSPSRRKEVLRTASHKTKDGNIIWNEGTTFNAAADSSLTFEIKASHTFSKNITLATGSLELSDVIEKTNEDEIKVSLTSGGELVVKVDYSDQYPKEDS